MDMTLLQLAIRAKIPLIAVTTDDPLNVGYVLEHYAGQPVKGGPKLLRGIPVLPPKSITYMPGDVAGMDMMGMYNYAIQQEAVLILVNPAEVHPAVFDAGTVVMPDSMISAFVQTYAPDNADHYSLEAALRGLSFKSMVETAKLAMAESGKFTADAILQIRRERTVLSNGLQLVDTNQFFYEPQDMLEDWLEVDGRLFTANVPRVIRPRGLLFCGSPGTGKTAGAKYLAHELRIPLYLLDVGSTMQKYVGESEKTFSAALTQVAALAPCVLLLDEIEKVFDNHDESGVSRRVLGMLLWWLQEHQAQVLTIMTTNNTDKIPSELIRPGRIDSHIYFRKLDELFAKRFALRLKKRLTNVCETEDSEIHEAIRKMFGRGISDASQAEVTQCVIQCVKLKMAAKLKE